MEGTWTGLVDQQEHVPSVQVRERVPYEHRQALVSDETDGFVGFAADELDSSQIQQGNPTLSFMNAPHLQVRNSPYKPQ